MLRSFLLRIYQIPRKCCIRRLTPAIPIQQQSPMKIGFPPVLTSFTRFVLNPMAAIAIIIKNLLSSLIGAVTVTGRENTVVMIEASTKNRIKNGKIFFRSKVPPACSPFFFAFHICKMERTSVIGMIARVLVNLTIVAASSVLLP